jgi:hypothetical protein
LIDAEVSPVDQENELPPLAVSVTADPAHVAVGPLMEAIGSAFTVTAVGEDVALQLPFETVTV